LYFFSLLDSVEQTCNLWKQYTEFFKNIVGKEITPVDSLPKSAKVPFQNRVAFIVHYKQNYNRKFTARIFLYFFSLLDSVEQTCNLWKQYNINMQNRACVDRQG
jgi:hypothetical protein